MTPPPNRERVVRAEYFASARALDQFPPPTLAEVAFLGRSNVGKSSLMNTLMGRAGLVRTSSTPGCTRQVSWFRAETADGGKLDLVDLPGYGYAKRSKSERNEWAGLIEDYLLTRPSLRATVLLVDARRGPEDEEHDLIQLLNTEARASRPPLTLLFVATKLDKLSHASHKPRLAELQKNWGRRVLGFSSTTAQGKEELWRQIRQAVHLTNVPEAPTAAPAP